MTRFSGLQCCTSEKGPSRNSATTILMSVKRPKAEVARRQWHFRDVPFPEVRSLRKSLKQHRRPGACANRQIVIDRQSSHMPESDILKFGLTLTLIWLEIWGTWVWAIFNAGARHGHSRRSPRQPSARPHTKAATSGSSPGPSQVLTRVERYQLTKSALRNGIFTMPPRITAS